MHYPVDPPNTFCAVQEEQENDNDHNESSSSTSGERPPLVTIQDLNKAVVDDDLATDGKENPYREMCRYPIVK